jgi:hypothetical protein
MVAVGDFYLSGTRVPRVELFRFFLVTLELKKKFKHRCITSPENATRSYRRNAGGEEEEEGERAV